MADLRISDLPELASGQLQAEDPLAIVDVSASTTKKVQASVLVLDAIKVLPDGSIPSGKVDSSGLAPGSVDTAALADKSVTAAKLADDSSAGVSATLPATGAFVGQLWVTTSGALPEIYAWNGTSWIDASGVVNVQGDTNGLVNVYVVESGSNATISADIDNTSASGQFLAGPANSAGVISQRIIVPTDLPTAGVEKGAVAVNGNGLTMSGNSISIDNTVGANTTVGYLVTYNDKGLVTGGSPILPSDLPLAVQGNVGAVQPGPGLSVDATGALGISNVVVGGTFPKITFNEQGLCIAGDILVDADIPNLSTDKIVSGSFGSARIQANAIESSKVADYATSFIQEALPSITTDDFIGKLWYQESTAQLRMWNGNSFMAVGFGRLSNENLRWGGVIDASTGLMTGVTSAGTTAGLVIGNELPAATDQLGGLYVVVSEPGNAIGVVPGETFTAGDWCLCVSSQEGWIRIEITGGGGGGGATNLGDLLDVTLSGEATGDFLQLQSNGQWQNIPEINGGTF